MTKLANNWRQKSLETLENHNWGDPADASTSLVKRCIELSKVPLDNFTTSDLRLMIGQQLRLQFLIPLALAKLQDDIFIEADFYEGDMLSNVLSIDTSFLTDNQSHWVEMSKLIKNKREEIAELEISTTKFDDAKFGTTKGCH